MIESDLNEYNTKLNYFNKLSFAGILLIFAGISGIANSYMYYKPSSFLINYFVENYSNFGLEISTSQAAELISTCGTIGIIISLVPIIGSILCFRKKMWGFALGFAIIGIFSFGILYSSVILSIISVFIIYKSKEEFKVD